MKKNLVSVIVASYNYHRYLPAAIESVLAQTYKDWELVIVDDASTDDSPALIERYRRRYPDRIRSVFLRENGGQAAAINRGLATADGEFVSFLGSDDQARPERLHRAVALLRENSQLAAIVSKVAYIDHNGRPAHVVQDVFNRAYTDLRWQMLEGNFLCAPSAVVRSTALANCGGFNPELRYTEDYDLWMRLLDHSEITRTNDVWVDYRLHGDNLSIAQSLPEQRAAPLYESMAVAVRAMRRWSPERLQKFRSKPGTAAHRKELADLQIRLAETCLRLHQKFAGPIEQFGVAAPGIALSAAYELALDARQNDPENPAAKPILEQLYFSFGDAPRVATGRSASLAQLTRQSERPDTPAIAAAIEPQLDSLVPQHSTAEAPPVGSDYEAWLELLKFTRSEARQYDQLREADQLNTRFHLATILVPGNEGGLIATLRSLTQQYHNDLLVTVVTEVAEPPGITNERLHWITVTGNQWETVRDALIHEQADWVGYIACGDLLSESSLTMAAEAIRRHPEWEALYFDSDQVGSDGLFNPQVKPDFDATLHRSAPYIHDLTLVSWESYAAIGGHATHLGPTSTYDLGLKISEQGPQAIGHVAGIHLHCANPPMLDAESALVALQAHLARIGGGIARSGMQKNTFSIALPLPDPSPRVSIVIPTRDRPAELSRCIESILSTTAYDAYEIVVVDHDCRNSQARAFLDGLSNLAPDRIRVFHQPRATPFAALLAAGAQVSDGELLLFLHDDVAPLHVEWLTNLVAHVTQPGVVAASARLLAPDGTLQHAGIVLGMGECADLVGVGTARENPGHLNRFSVPQEVSAASTACLLVRRSAFEMVGGFDPENYPMFLADVDLCLRLSETGGRIVWTPEATLLHSGPTHLREGIRASPLSPAERTGIWESERRKVLTDRLDSLAADTHYSRFFSTHTPGFELSPDPCLIRDNLPWKPLTRVLAQPADRHGCGYYRISSPILALDQAGFIQGFDSQQFYSPVEIQKIEPDLLILQRPYTDDLILYLQQLAEFSPARRVFDIDDLMTQIPEGSVHRRAFPPDLWDRLKRAASLCDSIVVSTEPLAEAFRAWHDDIRVARNRLSRHVWENLAPPRNIGEKPRVGWAGARGHEGDLAMVSEVIETLRDEVDWVILGHCPDALRGFVREVHPMVPLADYPNALASLGLDVAIAPLEVNSFNEAKSSLKLLEYGILGYPVICTNITPYQDGFPVTRVRNRPGDWVKAIRELAFDRARAQEEGVRLKEHVNQYWLIDNHLEEWRAAWSV